jgi:hypothetical protein
MVRVLSIRQLAQNFHQLKVLEVVFYRGSLSRIGMSDLRMSKAIDLCYHRSAHLEEQMVLMNHNLREDAAG